MDVKSQEFKLLDAKKKLSANSDAAKLLKRQPTRIFVNEADFLSLTGSGEDGKPVLIEKVENSSQQQPTDDSLTPAVREATLWKTPKDVKLEKDGALIYDSFRDLCGYKFGGQIRVTFEKGSCFSEADEVVLEEDTHDPEPMSGKDVDGWEYFLAAKLSAFDHVHVGLRFKDVYMGEADKRSFVVASVNGRPYGNARYIWRKTVVSIGKPSPPTAVAAGELQVIGVRGMDEPLTKLNDLLHIFDVEEPYRKGFPNPNIVIHGGHGTGKTMLLDKIANTGWGTVFRIQIKDKSSDIRETFQQAIAQQPSIVLMDQFERLIDKDRSNRNAVITAICEGLDSLSSKAKTTGVAPKVVVIAACLDFTSDIPEDLKKARRFHDDIFLPLPDVTSRREILSSFKIPIDPAEMPSLLDQLSERTHAYNGDDLERLVLHGWGLGAIRSRKSLQRTTTPSPSPPDDMPDLGNLTLLPTIPSPPPICTPSDFLSALKTVRPSAMHDINLKPPPIRFSDIGGQHSVKISLRRAVRLSTESPTVLARYFDHPPKGFLLYGPPGCSKTMAAQAMATESGLNFFAVKGAELLNMYVGESERAVRKIFARAREVAPSMIFFDEIDSIAGQRHGFGNSGGKTTGTSSGLNVLTTLLNEMDGFEALQGVVVLAATNRPQALDPALLRPGRFDELIYVGPPDKEARKAIFEGVARKRLMAEDIDVEALASETDGFSGAEIKGICAVAGVAAYDRSVGLQQGESVEGEEGEAVAEEPIRMEDLRKAIGMQKKQITEDMIKGFDDWEKQFRKH